MAEVAIVVPFYNAGELFRRCLLSIQAQTMKDFIVVLVDDRGRDKSIDVAREFARVDKRFIVLRNPKNMGAGASRNQGIEWVLGGINCKYISFVDADDFIAPDFLERLVNAAKKTKSPIAVGRGILCKSDGETETFGQAITAKNGVFVKPLEKLKGYVCWGRIFSIALIKKYNLRFPVDPNNILMWGEDWFFAFQAAAYSERVVCDNMAIYFYCENPNSCFLGEIAKKNNKAHSDVLTRFKMFADWCRTAPVAGQKEYEKFARKIFLDNTINFLSICDDAIYSQQAYARLRLVLLEFPSEFRRIAKEHDYLKGRVENILAAETAKDFLRTEKIRALKNKARAVADRLTWGWTSRGKEE